MCLNAANTIRRTISSVQAQSFGAIEHIIVDGGSSDGTLEIIRLLARPQDYWISETDRGIRDAFNKGAGGVGLYCPEIVAHMTHAGVSNRQFARTIHEVRQIVIAHGRSRLLAGIEARARLLKTGAAQPIKRSFYPLYSLVRRRINPSYRPAD